MAINGLQTRTQILAIWVSLLLAIFASRWLHLLHGAINTSVVIYATIVAPGMLLTLLLGWKPKVRPIEFLASSIILGLSSALILASIIVRFRIPVQTFWVVILTFAAITTLLIFWFKSSEPEVKEIPSTLEEVPILNTILIVLVLIVLTILVILSTRAFANFPTMLDFRLVDKKNYLTVIAMYADDIENVGLSPTDRELVRPSIQRLLWSGWLYLQAFWSKASQSPTIQFMMRDLRASLIVMWAIVNYAFMRRLFKHRGLALIALLATTYFANFVFADLFLYRLEEDKWIALYMFVPAAAFFVLHALDTRMWRSYIGLLLCMIAMGLLHPIASPTLLLIAFPFAIGEYIIQRFVDKQKVSIWPTVIILAILLVGLVSPLFDRIYLVYGLDARAYNVIDNPRNPTLGYSAVAPVDPLMLLPIYTVIVMLLFTLRDRSTRFIVLGLVILWIFLYTEPGAFIGARLVTKAQLWRMRLAIPFGLAWAWWLGLAWQSANRFLPEKYPRQLVYSGITVLFAISAIGIVTLHHGDNFTSWVVRYQNSESMPEEMYDALTVFADAIDTERELVIVDPQYSIITPTIFVKSHHVYFNHPENGIRPDTDLYYAQQFYENPSDETLSTLLELFSPRYIVATEDSASDSYLQSTTLTGCCEPIMSENGYVLYAVPND